MSQDVITVGLTMRIPLLYRGDVNDALGYKKKDVVVTSDPLALVAEKTNVSKKKRKLLFFRILKEVTKMLLAKKYSDEQVLLAEDQDWMKFSSDSDQEINANMVYMAQIKKVLSESDESSSSAEETITENSKMIAPGMFKLSMSQNVSPILMLKTSCESNNVERETRSAYGCNDAMNVSCNSRMCDLFDDNNFFIFDDESVRISPVSKMLFRKKPHDSMNVRSESNMNKSLPRTVHKWLRKMQPLAEPVAKWIPSICLWIIESRCSKHMTGNRTLLTNFVEKFLGTVPFGNKDFAVIAGYGDVVIGSMTIKKVYYVEGLGHNLFSVGQFCDKGLEVAFRKSTCFVRNEDGVDMLTGDRSSNLYTIALNEVASNSLTCLLAKASSSQSWLWHQHNLYNGRKGIGFENPSYFEKAKDLRQTLYDKKVIGLGYTLMFLTHSDEALEIEKFKRSRENKIEFAYDYGNFNASYVNKKINFEDDYFQEIINPDFDKIDSPF
nr:integrase, catalytic region, zinc finger, CCHC-type, peptidase aspartic, catalytic [Tanacetum cinerariifolium]